MHWLWFQLMVMTINSSSGIFDQWLEKQKLNKPHLLLIGSSMVSLPIVVITCWQQPVQWRAMPVGLLSGLLFCATVFLYSKAVSLESAEMLAFPGRLLTLIALPVNMFIFNERISTWQLIAFLGLVSGGLWLVSRNKRSPIRWSRGLSLMFLVEVLFLTQGILRDSMTLGYGAPTMLMWERCGVILGSMAILLQCSTRRELLQLIQTLPRPMYAILLSKQSISLLSFFLSGMVVQAASSPSAIVLTTGGYPFLIFAIQRSVVWLQQRSSSFQIRSEEIDHSRSSISW